MSAPVYEASHAEERPADLAEGLVAIPSDRVLATAARARAGSCLGTLAVFVDPDRHGDESIAGALPDGWKMRYCAAACGYAIDGN